jgi:hypothetical protein
LEEFVAQAAQAAAQVFQRDLAGGGGGSLTFGQNFGALQEPL